MSSVVAEGDGTGASSDLSHVVAVGPEVNAFWPKLALFTSLRYAIEVDAANRPQGQTVVLTLPKGF